LIWGGSARARPFFIQQLPEPLLAQNGHSKKRILVSLRQALANQLLLSFWLEMTRDWHDEKFRV
jgi:hypothetical protein